MSYNWKCCSFYPNDFGASALKKAIVAPNNPFIPSTPQEIKQIIGIPKINANGYIKNSGNNIYDYRLHYE